MAAPAMTINAQAGLLASGSLAAATTNTGTALDLSAKFEGQIQVKNTGGGTVNATNGVTVLVYRQFGAGPTNDTVAATSFTIPTTASTATYQSFALPTGKYLIKLQNLDPSNAVTVEMSLSTIDSVA